MVSHCRSSWRGRRAGDGGSRAAALPPTPPALPPPASPPLPVPIELAPALLPPPHRLPDGPQSAMAVLQLHEAQRRRRPPPAAPFAAAQQLMQLCATLLLHVSAGTPPPPRLSRAAAARRPPLALLVASHVREASRVGALARCLASIGGQADDPPAAVLLSWSAADSLRGAVRAAVAREGAAWLTAWEQPAPLKQFEHLALLAHAAAEVLGRDAWVCFCDDDDVVHPRRCAAYAAAIGALPAEVRAVGAAWNARPVVAEKVAGAQHVDELVRAGRVQMCSGDGQRHAAWDEYFNYAIELQTLLSFFGTACPPPARRSMYADLALLSYIKNCVLTARFKPSSAGFADNWAYFYDKPIEDTGAAAAQGNISGGVTSTDADLHAARRLREIGSLPTIQRMSDSELELLASQQRSILEIYCQSFAGAPQPVPLPAFFMLGKLALLDHMEALGYTEFALANDANLNKLISEQIQGAACTFCVSTIPSVSSMSPAAPACSIRARSS
ncbi:hypothetical protein AB1Y20_010510 [Prymnesium parvum]|uniref:Uncharacterized protein n=1 Tax=Prymnesium parvum TaxID=97485 RepID=A0AB34ISG3_PRYPA